jgi:hypothetical protein
MQMGEGLQRVLKLYGRMVIQGELWLWDYAKNTPVKAKNMRVGSSRHARSERARTELIRADFSPPSSTPRE